MTFSRIFLCVMLGCLSSVGVAQQGVVVGMTTRAFTDAARKNWQGTGPRPLNTVVWYPAAAGSVAKPFVAAEADARFYGDPSFGKFFTEIPVAMNAPLLKESKKHPLILLSHGSSSLSLELMWLGDYLAAHGYIVAAVNHHGNTSAEGQMLPQGFLEWERAEDLKAVLTDLLSDPEFGGQIDRSRIGAAGHSAGGATVIQIAGGHFDTDAITAYCASPESKGDGTCEPRELIRQSVARISELKKTDPVVEESFRHEAESQRDPRVKAVFAMAPAIGPAFTKKGLSGIHIPVEIVVGDADDIAPMATNAERFAKLIHGAKLIVLPRVGHMTFGSACTELGKEKLDGCRDPRGVDRVAVQGQVERQALAFFDGVWAKE